jgi:Subtilase family
MGDKNHLARRTSALLCMGVAWLCTTAGADTVDAWHHDSAGRVQVDVQYDCSLSPPRNGLSAAGLTINAAVRVAPFCVIEGWVAPTAISRLSSVTGVTGVKAPAYATHIQPRSLTPTNTPSQQTPTARQKAQGAAVIDGNALSIMRADQFVSQTHTNGSGVTVGVQSTGVTSLAVIQGRGELPATVQVVTPSGQSSPALGDEGTALLEEIHAVAPGAGLAFCGPETFVEYTSCLGQLIAAGATILVDDIIFAGEDLMSTDSTSAQGVAQLLAQHPQVMLFTSAGNYTNSYWEGTYTPIVAPVTLSCTTGDVTQVDHYVAQIGSGEILTTQGGIFPLIFAWADPPGQNVSNFDLYWFNGATQVGCASGTGLTDNSISLKSFALAAGSYTLYIATPDTTWANKFLKLWAGGDGLTSLSSSTAGSVISPQSFAAGAITIGAVNGSDGVGNTIESFSSLGPLKVAFPSMADIQAPVLVAPDGIYVDAAGTYFQGALFPDGNFYGTSASVPNAGAVAALIRGAFPSFSVADVLATLKQGATQLGASPPDGTYGHGRVDAMGALGVLPAPTITSIPDSTVDPGASSMAYPFTVTGTGPLHFTVTSSDSRLIPASIVSAGSPGLTVAPSTCGTTTLSCTLAVTASTVGGGSVSVTFSALDGANRAAPAAMKVTITGPPAPPADPTPPPTSPPASGGGGGGGVLRWWELLALALIALIQRASPPRSPGAPKAYVGRLPMT